MVCSLFPNAPSTTLNYNFPLYIIDVGIYDSKGLFLYSASIYVFFLYFTYLVFYFHCRSISHFCIARFLGLSYRLKANAKAKKSNNVNISQGYRHPKAMN